MTRDAEESGLDPVIHQPVRMRILAALHRNRQLDFPTLRDALALTPGNLGNHLERLEKSGYVETARAFSAVGFAVRYRITPEGSAAFRTYVARLRALLADIAAPDADAEAPAPGEPPREA